MSSIINLEGGKKKKAMEDTGAHNDIGCCRQFEGDRVLFDKEPTRIVKEENDGQDWT